MFFYSGSQWCTPAMDAPVTTPISVAFRHLVFLFQISFLFRNTAFLKGSASCRQLMIIRDEDFQTAFAKKTIKLLHTDLLLWSASTVTHYHYYMVFRLGLPRCTWPCGSTHTSRPGGHRFDSPLDPFFSAFYLAVTHYDYCTFFASAFQGVSSLVVARLPPDPLVAGSIPGEMFSFLICGNDTPLWQSSLEGHGEKKGAVITLVYSEKERRKESDSRWGCEPRDWQILSLPNYWNCMWKERVFSSLFFFFVSDNKYVVQIKAFYTLLISRSFVRSSPPLL